MTEEVFSEWATLILVGGLITFMGFIIYDLAKKSNAGKLGMFVLFGVLGFGVTGFVFKEIMVRMLKL